MAAASAPPSPEEVEQRLRDLEQIHELGMALRSMRFESVEDPPPLVAEKPAPYATPGQPDEEPSDS